MSGAGTAQTPAALPEPRRSRWEPLRAGLQNIWEYDDQRFVFHHGRLLLRGRNETGKTKALEVLLPFLLDADLSPQRLDPFGSAARPMRWNLLNEDNPEITTRVGYVWLELGRQGEQGPQFCTVGAGLRAKRTTPGVSVWYFLTSLRPDRDLQLLGPGRVPLVRRRLEQALGQGGQVFQRAGDYRRAINRALFEMPAEQYRALIEALLQLRRPQLSKVLQPAELSRILTASLPPLEGRVIEPLAEGFERLDRHRQEREAWQQTLAAVQGFTHIYRNYVAIVARRRARALTRAESAHHKARAEHRRWQEQVEQAQSLLEQLTRQQHQLEAQRRILDERIATLRDSEEYRSVQALDRAEVAARGAAEQQRRADRRLQQDRQTLARRQEHVAVEAEAVALRERRMQARREECAQAARAADLSRGHRGVERQLLDADLDGARGTLQSLYAERQAAVDLLAAAAARVQRARDRLTQAEGRTSDRQAAVREAEEEVAAAEQAALGRGQAFARQVEQWMDSLAALELADHLREASLARLPYGARPEVEAAAQGQRLELVQQLSELGAALSAVGQELDEVVQQREALAARTHQPPSVPAWRGEREPRRPGAPLYMLCDFATDDPAVQAGVEVALEGAGLLDAWVTPAGELLDPQTLDVVLRPAPRSGPSLEQVLVPDVEAEVPAGVVSRVLRSVAYDAAASAEQGACWIDADGRWRVGPLHGRAHRSTAVYIGAAARQRARQTRLDELDRLLATLRRQEQATRAHQEAQRQRLERLDEELRAFPPDDLVRQAEARVQATQQQLGQARGRLEEAQAAAARCEQELAGCTEQRDREAAQLGLGRWVEQVELLRRLGQEYHGLARELLRQGEELQAGRLRLEQEQHEADQAAVTVREAEGEATQARELAARATARAAQLREVVGEPHQALLRRLREAEDQVQEGDAERQSIAELQLDQRESYGRAEAAAHGSANEMEQTDGARRVAEVGFKRLASAGLLALLELELPGEPAGWSLRDALVLARRVDEQNAELQHDQQALDRAENRVTEQHQQLTRGLRQEVRVVQQREEGIPEYSAHWAGQRFDMPGLMAALKREVAASERLLGDEERQLFESFLSGEAHQHLRVRLQQAHQLVQRMNDQLRRRPTASGMKLRLDWGVTEDAPAGARQAIDLLLRTPGLLSNADHDSLRKFLQQRLDEARASDGQGSLQERMAAVLDYRGWRSFTVTFRPAGAEGWRKLTRRAHAAGSGGQKAVVLHLPLFAAAAAFYESAAATAPRLIVLDEAFAGIDRATRGELMELLAEFELDFIMTSYEEWGFYEQLDGLSTYHLSRMTGMRGVHTDWFVWDGRRALELEQGLAQE